MCVRGCHSLCRWRGRFAASCAADPGASRSGPSVEEEQRASARITPAVRAATQTHTRVPARRGGRVAVPRRAQPGRRKRQLPGAAVERGLCRSSRQPTQRPAVLFPAVLKRLGAIRRNSEHFGGTVWGRQPLLLLSALLSL